MIRVIMLIPVLAVLLACGLIARINDSAKPQVTGDIVVGQAPGGGSAPPPGGDLPLPPYAGDSLIDEKIIEYPVIVKATTTSFSSDTFRYPDGTFRPVLRFNLNVSEYLKGTGPSSIVAVWFYERSFDARGSADNWGDVIVAHRDGQWDDREAIFFLVDGPSVGPSPLLSTQPQLANQYVLGLGDRYSVDDRYSLHSQHNKRWLPAAGTSPTGDSQEFLLDVPPPTETITLGELKRKITEVASELDGGDDSEEYQECILEKYRYIRNQRNWPEERGNPYGVWDLNYSLISGQPAGTVLDQRESGSDEYPDPTKVITLWLEGVDSAQFDIAQGDSTVSDTDGDGEDDTIKYDEIVRLARPIPAGVYRFDLKESWPRWAVCSFVISNEWTVTVTAPDGVVHEALFDPVVDDSAVAADNSNGVLDPAAFIDAGATTTIERIEWEAGTAKLKLAPHNALAGRAVDFIELDGTVSLSLVVDDATVDAANNTLSWSVSPQPWDDGDKLMLRIREAS